MVINRRNRDAAQALFLTNIKGEGTFKQILTISAAALLKERLGTLPGGSHKKNCCSMINKVDTYCALAYTSTVGKNSIRVVGFNF